MPYATLERKTKPVQVRRQTRSSSTTGPGHIFSQFVDKIIIRPDRTIKLPIGNTIGAHPPKGFCIKMSSTMPDEIIDMEVVTAGTKERYEYLLRITNHSLRMVRAEVWAM